MKKSGKRHSIAISRERTLRLYRLLRELEVRPATRSQLLRKLRVGMRTFYRDLDVLRQCGVLISISGQKYRLASGAGWVEVLPFPDPELSFADALALATGKSPAAKKMQSLLSAFGR